MAKPMLDGTLMFPSEYLAAEEFGGRDIKLKIKDVKFDDLRLTKGGTERKPILSFEKTPKKLVLNKTNATTIAKLHGSEARGWIGKEITLYPTECDAFGATVDCIRVRPRNKPGGNELAATPTQEITRIAAQKVVTEDDFNRACELSGLPPEQIETDDVMPSVATGDYKAAVKAVLNKMAGGTK